MMFLGDFRIAKTVRFLWNTNAVAGESITRATNGTVSVYKDGGTTQSTTGVTDTEDFDSLTGVHLCAVDTSADGTFYSAGSDFAVVLSGATIDGKAINAVLAHFSLEARSALMPTTDGRKLDVSAGGEAGVDWANVGSPTTTLNLSGTTVKTATDVETDTADIQSRLPAALVSGRIDASVGAMAANVLTATAIAADAITDAKVASDVTIASVTGAVGSVTGNVGGNVVGSVGSVTGNVGGNVVGSVGSVTATVSADVVSLSGDTAAADNAESFFDGTGYGAVLQRTTITNLSSQTVFDLSAGSADDDAYNYCVAVIQDASTAAQKAVVVVNDYAGATKTVTLQAAPAFTVANTDVITILACRALKPTVNNRHLDVSAGGEAGVDWANVGTPGSTVNLSATTVNLANTTTTVTNRVSANVDQIDGAAWATHSAGYAPADVRQYGGSAGTFASGRPAVTIADAAHGGSSASFAFGAGGTISNASGSALTLTSSGSNGHGLSANGNGTGNGIRATGGATGHGLYGLGGSSSGQGMRAEGQAGNSIGFSIVGAGTQPGLRVTGGATGAGFAIVGGGTSGAGISVTTTSGDGVSVTPTDGHAVVVSGNGTDKHGLQANGSAGGAGHGAQFNAGAGGTGLIADSAEFTSFSVTTNLIDWRAAWDAEVQSEVQDALEANHLDHLIAVADPGGVVANSSFLAKLVSKSATPAFSSYDNTTDSLEAQRDNVGTTGGALVLAKTTNITGFNDLSASAVNAEVVDALATDTYAEPGQGAPAATATLAAKLNYLYKAWRNKKDQTSTTFQLYADDATTVDQKATVSDSAGTTTIGEIATGP